ncbi:MAG: GreA/GreB family elongation factor [Verrucomicrobiota bacterium]|nr:GreA/GreB family elongation factor [Verrucomicrobiota bacterium]
MEEDIKKAIESGKITAQAGRALASLKAGAFCLHKSWGFGQIESIDFLLNQATIDFKNKRAHTMQLQYAAESLQPIAADHILAQKATNLDGVRKMAADDPVGLVRLILRDRDGKASQEQIAQILSPDVLNETDFKRWWESTKKALKKDGHFSVPAKKGAPIELREQAVSRADELLAAFSSAVQLKDQLQVLDRIIKNVDVFSDPSRLVPVIAAVEDAAMKTRRLHAAQSFDLILSRDELCEKLPALKPNEGALTIAKLLQDEERRLSDILPNLPAARQKRLVTEVPGAFGEEWSRKALALMMRTNSIRVVAEIGRLLQTQQKGDMLRRELERWISEHSVTPEVLYWLCKERTGELSDLIHPSVFNAMLSALERDQFTDTSRGGKLRDLLLDDRELVSDLLNDADPELVRDSMRKLLLTPVFEELDKRSLMGRIIRVHPELQSMIASDSTEKQEALVVSWASLEKRKADYEDLVTKKIPENTKEIGIARSYGDLRENFEFKAAKEMQRVLMRRKAETEQALARARGTNFESPDLSQVSIGTVVTLKDRATEGTERYAILGAWDSDPQQGVISYLAAIGQALLGHKVGEQIPLPTEAGSREVEIVSIEPHLASVTPVAVAAE